MVGRLSVRMPGGSPLNCTVTVPCCFFPPYFFLCLVLASAIPATLLIQPRGEIAILPLIIPSLAPGTRAQGAIGEEELFIPNKTSATSCRQAKGVAERFGV